MCSDEGARRNRWKTEIIIINNIGKKGVPNIAQSAITAIIMQFNIIAKLLGVVKGFSQKISVLSYIFLFVV